MFYISIPPSRLYHNGCYKWGIAGSSVGASSGSALRPQRDLGIHCDIVTAQGVPNNSILFHFGVPNNQILDRFGVPDNQTLLHLGVLNNCSSGPSLAGTMHSLSICRGHLNAELQKEQIWLGTIKGGGWWWWDLLSKGSIIAIFQKNKSNFLGFIEVKQMFVNIFQPIPMPTELMVKNC